MTEWRCIVMGDDGVAFNARFDTEAEAMAYAAERGGEAFLMDWGDWHSLAAKACSKPPTGDGPLFDAGPRLGDIFTMDEFRQSERE